MKTIAVVISFICITGWLPAQEIMTFGKGNIDVMMNVYSSDYYHSDYPGQYAMVSAGQQFSLSGLPFVLQGGFSSMPSMAANGLYPNYVHLSFGADDFRKSLMTRYNQKVESEWIGRVSAERKRALLMQQSAQIDSALAGYDEKGLSVAIAEKETGIAAMQDADSVALAQRELQDLYSYRDAWDHLKNLKLRHDSIVAKGGEVQPVLRPQGLNRDDFSIRKKDIRSKIELTGAEKLAMQVERLNAGRFVITAHPFVSQQTMADGIELKLSPSRLSLSALYGKMKTQYLPFTYLAEAENATVAGGAFGFSWASTKTEFFTYNFRHSDVRNEIIGVTHQSDITEKISAGFTLSGSQYVAGAPDTLNEYSSSQLPLEYQWSKNSFVTNILFQHKTPAFLTGWAFDGKVTLRRIIKGNRIFTGYEYISPAYFSLAAPFLIKDMGAFCLGTEQLLYKNKLRMSITGRMRYKEESEWYPYRTGRQSMTLKTIFSPGEKLNVVVLYQYNQRFSEKGKTTFTIANAGVQYRADFLLRTTHSLQAMLIGNPAGGEYKNVMYSVMLPVTSKTDISCGYGHVWQSELKRQLWKAELLWRPSEKLRHSFTGAFMDDDVCTEYFGGYGVSFPLVKNCVGDVMTGYGSYQYNSYVSGSKHYKAGLTARIQLRYTW